MIMVSTPVEWQWREFRFALPADWEMLQFSRRRPAGKCAFADRHGFRLELNWQTAAHEPELDLMLQAYQEELDDDNAEACRHGPWTGLRLETEALQSTRFGRWFAELKRVVELVFLWPTGMNQATETEILDSFRAVPVSGLWQSWQAFGMTLAASADLDLENCLQATGRARLEFQDADGKQRLETYERLGLVDHWLRGNLRDWLREEVAPELHEPRWRSRQDAEHPIETVVAAAPALNFPKIATRRLPYRAAAWRCPADGRIYCVREHGKPSVAPNDDAALPLVGGRLRCCPDLPNLDPE